MIFFFFLLQTFTKNQHKNLQSPVNNIYIIYITYMYYICIYHTHTYIRTYIRIIYIYRYIYRWIDRQIATYIVLSRTHPIPPLFKQGGTDLTKNPRKGGDEKFVEGQGGSQEGGRCFQSGYFFQLGCGKSNYCNFQLHLGHGVPISIEYRCQPLF